MASLNIELSIHFSLQINNANAYFQFQSITSKLSNLIRPSINWFLRANLSQCHEAEGINEIQLRLTSQIASNNNNKKQLFLRFRTAQLLTSRRVLSKELCLTMLHIRYQISVRWSNNNNHYVQQWQESKRQAPLNRYALSIKIILSCIFNITLTLAKKRRLAIRMNVRSHGSYCVQIE